jgi:uncharacterized membrane protein
MLKAEIFFTSGEKEKIIQAVKTAETDTSGEIRIHIENKCKGEVLDRAAYLFDKLRMQKTAKRNGVLFYLGVQDKKFAILGDVGINAVTPDDFWNNIKEAMLDYFQKGEFANGLEVGILMTGKVLKEHFPYMEDDKNELSDEISFEKK